MEQFDCERNQRTDDDNRDEWRKAGVGPQTTISRNTTATVTQVHTGSSRSVGASARRTAVAGRVSPKSHETNMTTSP